MNKKVWCIICPSTHLHGMKAKRKPIINIHQSLRWIRDVYTVLVVCLSDSFMPLCVRNTQSSDKRTSKADFSPPLRLKASQYTSNTWTQNIESERTERGSGYTEERETWISSVLTLDVDCDTGFLAVGDCLIGGLADDLLTCLDVGRW